MSKWFIVLAAVLESAMIALIIQLRAPAPAPALATAPPTVTASPAAATSSPATPAPSPSPTAARPTATTPPTSTPLPSATPIPPTNTPAPTQPPVAPTAPPPPPPTSAPQPAPASGFVGNTNGLGVYLRHSPNPSDLWVAWPDNTPLTILGPQATVAGQPWLQVRDPAGDIGWVPARFIVVK